jgi:hypothetical protein
MDEITNRTLQKFITIHVVDWFAMATDYDWNPSWRFPELFGLGQLGADGYKVSVNIEPLPSCDVCHCTCSGDDLGGGNYLCNDCGEEHLEWLDIAEGVSVVIPVERLSSEIPIEYLKYAEVTITGRSDGVDVVFHTSSVGS